MTIEQTHIDNAKKARDLYRDNLRPTEAAAEWQLAVRESRKLVAAAMRASKYLADVEGALRINGAHSLVFRHLLAHPLSQDQFKLVCPLWNKGSENNGTPATFAAATEAAVAIRERLDYGIVKWAKGSRPISRQDVVTVLRVVSALIALQKVSTGRRGLIAAAQENSVIKLLKDNGWKLLPSNLLDTRAALDAYHFMHKTRFATKTTAPQEVDIACGLGGTYVLAMECKVTNDETNSVKRVNDVVKKANAWKDHWGSFVITAALLQGVIAAKDVQRMTDAGIHLFWSHDLPAFYEWLSGQIRT